MGIMGGFKNYYWLLIRLVWLGLVVLVSISRANETFCRNEQDSMPEENGYDQYHLFCTKTSYLSARKELAYRYRHVRWPTEMDRCTPIYLYLLSRHGIRYPGANEITFLNELLPSLRTKLLQSGKLSYKMTMYMAGWRTRMTEADGFRLTETGKIETARLAEYLAGYFPRLLLNLTEENVEVGTTPKIRTDETAQAFIDSLFNKHADDDADGLESKTTTTKDDERQKMKTRFQMPKILTSHKQCRKLIKKSHGRGHKLPECKAAKNLLESTAFKAMVEQFAVRTGLAAAANQTVTLSFESFLGIYRGCAYELAIYGFSPWCLLFTRRELKLLEYLIDLEEYHDAYEIEPHRMIGCKLIQDLKLKIQTAIRKTDIGGGSGPKNVVATLYFSHENLLNKLWSYLELFKSFPKKVDRPPSSTSGQDDDIFCLPENREWRTSLVLPFGSNLVTVLYRCPSITKRLDHHQYRLFTMINEIPVRIRGCHDSFCDVEQFFHVFNHTETECDLDAICRM